MFASFEEISSVKQIDTLPLLEELEGLCLSSGWTRRCFRAQSTSCLAPYPQHLAQCLHFSRTLITLFFFFFFFLSFVFLPFPGPLSRHMEVPRLGV